jgi:hypothetical protein
MNTHGNTTSAANSMSTPHRRRAGWRLLTVLALLALALGVGRAATPSSASPVRIAPALSDSEWVGLGSGMNRGVEALAVSGSNLYAGGMFTTAGGVPAKYIAKWDGNAWSALGSGVDFWIYALATSGTNLYVGGGFTNAGGVRVNHIAKWDGNTWSALGSGVGYEDQGTSSVTALAVSGTNLYVGGAFSIAGGLRVNFIAKWDGSTWSALASGMDCTVVALAVSGTNLYAGGCFTTAGGVPASYIAKWDGTAWSSLGSGLTGYSIPGVHCLAVSGSNLYAGGYISGAGGLPVNCIAMWNGSAWSALGSGLSGTVMPNVTALAVNGTDLYAGGQFTTAGGVPANSIAKWDGLGWTALGSGVNNTVVDLAADGAGHLFVGGEFSLAGTNVFSCIAQANVGSAPTISTPPRAQTAEVGTTVILTVRANGYPPPTYRWYVNGTNMLSCTSCELVLTNMALSDSGTYSVFVTNACGAVTSAVTVNVIPAVERRPVPGVELMGQAGSSWDVVCADSLGLTPNWTWLGSVSLSAAPQYFFDLTLPLPAHRFYRAQEIAALPMPPVLGLRMVPAITLTGSIGDSVRVDYINRYGPTDAWVTLDTVELTNTSQLYFDLSAPGQPQRLYQLVPAP